MHACIRAHGKCMYSYSIDLSNTCVYYGEKTFLYTCTITFFSVANSVGLRRSYYCKMITSILVFLFGVITFTNADRVTDLATLLYNPIRYNTLYVQVNCFSGVFSTCVFRLSAPFLYFFCLHGCYMIFLMFFFLGNRVSTREMRRTVNSGCTSSTTQFGATKLSWLI